ncbi:hypothetical protein CK203_078737 [Vitis vinifera]|uniref:Uncharacterized protein n=1 Tax=Vitis vinifera TaxID=29760 RepID=A0A438E677_VITVI|nr:hypothetical protein CK203_078737 [Vitis vinifera]
MITTTTTIVAIPPTHSAANPWWRGPSSTIIRFPPSKLRPLSSSPSTSVSVVEEGEEEAPPLPSDAAAPLQSQDPPLGYPFFPVFYSTILIFSLLYSVSE